MSYNQRPQGYPNMGQPPPYGYPPNQPLFEDTSYNPSSSYNPPPMGGDWNSQYPSSSPMDFSQQILNNPMAAMAMNEIAGRGKEFMNQKVLDKYAYLANLKYYFAVDTSYVAKKLGLIFFPFVHTDWSIKYNQDEPVAPRYDLNAPDLYIPAMAFVTFILTSGYLLGTQNKFSPEQLGIQASSTLGWLIIEFLVVYFSLYLVNVSSTLKWGDLAAFCGYKFVYMIVILLISIPLGWIGYIGMLAYSGFSLGFFLLKSLRVLILPSSHYPGSNRTSLYMLLAICVLQPVMMYWLSYHLLSTSPVSPPPTIPL